MARQGIGTGSSPNDGTGDNLRTAGGKINDNFSELYGYFGDGTTLSRGTWDIVSSGINTLSSVGIGTTNPRFTLEVGAVGASGTSLYVNGDARVTGILTVGSSSVTLNGSTNEITVGTGITINGNTGIISATQVTIAGETLTGAGVTSLVAGSNITLSGSTGQVTISSSGGSAGAGGTWGNYDGVLGVTTTKKVKIQNNLEVTGVTTSTSGLRVVGGGLTVTGVSTFHDNVELNANLDLQDNDKILLGTGDDLEIYHTGSHSFIVDSGVGSLYIRASAGNIQDQGNANQTWLQFNSAAGVEAHFAGSKKLETTAAGVSITGTSTCTGSVQVGAGQSFGANGPTAVYYGDASYITAGKWVLGANGSTDYTFTGPGFTATTNDPILYLARGQTYEFVNTMGAHPFQIRASNGGSAYNTGVTNNGTSNGTVRFEVPMDAPNTLYYQCTSHAAMGNTINIYPTI